MSDDDDDHPHGWDINPFFFLDFFRSDPDEPSAADYIATAPYRATKPVQPAGVGVSVLFLSLWLGLGLGSVEVAAVSLAVGPQCIEPGFCSTISLHEVLVGALVSGVTAVLYALGYKMVSRLYRGRAWPIVVGTILVGLALFVGGLKTILR